MNELPLKNIVAGLDGLDGLDGPTRESNLHSGPIGVLLHRNTDFPLARLQVFNLLGK